MTSRKLYTNVAQQPTANVAYTGVKKKAINGKFDARNYSRRNTSVSKAHMRSHVHIEFFVPFAARSAHCVASVFPTRRLFLCKMNLAGIGHSEIQYICG